MILMREICALCGEEKELQKSHIVPKFVGKWIKATSSTGLLRLATNPQKRSQDLPKIYLLCVDCETLFSKFETYFSSQIFYPFFKKDIQGFHYNSLLLKFVVSLAWRTLVTTRSVQEATHPWIKPHLETAEKVWREYLLGIRQDCEPYEHHLIFLGYVNEENEVPLGFHRYLLRGTDASLVNSNEVIFSYVHFPWMIFMSTIYPAKNEKWINSNILDSGEINFSVQMTDALFGDYLMDRIKLTNMDMGGDQRVLKSFYKNPERALLSESFKISLIETRKKRNRDLPPPILLFLEILESVKYSNDYSEIHSRLLMLHYSLMADRISKISKDEANRISFLLDSFFHETGITEPDKSIDFELNGVYVRFMVNYCESKDMQRDILDKSSLSINENLRRKHPFVLLVSFNPLEVDDPYELITFFPEE